MKKAGDWLYRWRYAVVLVMFALGVFFEISGSSIGVWGTAVGAESEGGDGNLLGESRVIRSDEWAVSTPMAFAQYYGEQPFSYYSDVMRGMKTDAYLIYGQAVKSWKILFRPFQIGYLLFAQGRGLAFFWCGRFFALLMVSFEFARYLWPERRLQSFCYAMLMVLSPVVQWWFAINGLVEMLIFGQLALLILAYYPRQQRYLTRLLLVFALVLCGGGYILVFYPSWQIPFGYAFLFLLLAILKREYRRERLDWKKDGLLFLLFLVLLGSSVGIILYDARDTVSTILNTVYPGRRSFRSGRAVSWLFNWSENLLYPYIDLAMKNRNVCESAGFLCFFPMGILGSIWVLLKEKKRDVPFLFTLAGTVFLTAYCCIRFPVPLEKLLLLSNCQTVRVTTAAGFLNLLLLFEVLYRIRERVSGVWSVLTVGLLTFAGMWVVYRLDPKFYQNTGLIFFVLAAFILGYSLVLLAASGKRKRTAVLGFLAFALFGGLFVNPVHKGVDVVYRNPLMIAINAVLSEDIEDDLWVVEGVGFPYMNYPIMAGAPTVNCTNVYPALERWEKLDTEKQWEEIYNRYAHILVRLVRDGELNMHKIADDQIEIDLSPEAMKELKVRTILSVRDLSSYSSEQFSLHQEYQVGSFRIYRVNYE